VKWSESATLRFYLLFSEKPLTSNIKHDKIIKSLKHEDKNQHEATKLF